jgi:HK97 family phage prohead protease
MEKIRKVFSGEIKEINEKDNTLISFVSTAAVDRMGDIIEQEGIDLKHYRKNPVVLWAHDYATPPIGKSLWIKKQDGGLISKMQFADTAFAQEIFSLYKGGFLKAFSIGFIPKEFEPIDKNEGMFGARRYKKTEMLEYSAVPVPANPEALSLAMSKGLTLSASMTKAIEDAHIDDIETSEEIKEKEEKSELTIEPYEDLIAENKSLNDKVVLLETENIELRGKVFSLLQKKHSEMTDQQLLRKAEEIMVGVIRKAQGKID